MTRINRQKASMILREEARKADNNESMSKEWVNKVEELSRRCTEGNAATHIAFLGTTLLAKSVEEEIDLCAIKPKHYPDNKLAYSARSLCHNVLVPLSAEIGINIAVTGREPLNNQPYFRMSYLKDGTPVHQKSKSAFDYMVALVDEISNMSKTSARKALSAYIYVRKQYQPNYLAHDKEAVATPEELLSSIVEFVNENSEGGRRAQAVVAGLMDAFAGQERVESGRINDPSRKHPGDVCIVSDNDEYCLGKSFRSQRQTSIKTRYFDLWEEMHRSQSSRGCLGYGFGKAILN